MLIIPTRIYKSLDDSKHVVDLRVDQHVIHLHADVLGAAQSVGDRPDAADKATAGVRATDGPRGQMWFDIYYIIRVALWSRLWWDEFPGVSLLKLCACGLTAGELPPCCL